VKKFKLKDELCIIFRITNIDPVIGPFYPIRIFSLTNNIALKFKSTQRRFKKKCQQKNIKSRFAEVGQLERVPLLYNTLKINSWMNM
jgi:hypothetical protein